MSQTRRASASAAQTSATAVASAPSAPARRSAGPRGALLALHRRYGNRWVQSVIQAKSNVGPADDPHQQDAERISRLAMAGPVAPRALGNRALGRLLEGARARPDTGGRTTSGGRPVPEGIRSSMEQTLGRDLSSVRVHEDERALAMNALAFTQGNHIHFAPGRYQPWNRQGQDALRHELVHVDQQAEGRVPATRRLRGARLNDDPRLEREADDRGRTSRRVTCEGEAARKDLAPLPASTASAAPIQRLSLSDCETVANDVYDALNVPPLLSWVFDGSYAIAIRSGYAQAPGNAQQPQNNVPVRLPKDIDLLFSDGKDLLTGVNRLSDSGNFETKDGSTSQGDSDGGPEKQMMHHTTKDIDIDMATIKKSEFAPTRKVRGKFGRTVKVSNFPERETVAPVKMLLAGALSRMDESGKRDISLVVDMIEKNNLSKDFISEVLPYVREDSMVGRDIVKKRWNRFFDGSRIRSRQEMTSESTKNGLGAL
ncbi:DUF4157 domain-containing protein [Streptomyces sp. ADMS]|uniref:DUF4157 domain-containing protein n=1 Tax=Streptomyces sp. ADMS TaxID=3071415 RepID=UPI00296EF6A0|nr:DUF4157 domain-containing protein [Streptomyces sp. ADMS]MDW4911118.1 DUF4157 domain-containing protein [Streptomyces sp. ADMS]